MINFFENLWDKIRTFVLEHEPVLETIFEVFFAILFLTWFVLLSVCLVLEL